VVSATFVATPGLCVLGHVTVGACVADVDVDEDDDEDGGVDGGDVGVGGAGAGDCDDGCGDCDDGCGDCDDGCGDCDDGCGDCDDGCGDCDDGCGEGPSSSASMSLFPAGKGQLGTLQLEAGPYFPKTAVEGQYCEQSQPMFPSTMRVKLPA